MYLSGDLANPLPPQMSSCFMDTPKIYRREQNFTHPICKALQWLPWYTELWEVTNFRVRDVFCHALGTTYANFQEKICQNIPWGNCQTFYWSNFTNRKSDYFLKEYPGICSAKGIAKTSLTLKYFPTPMLLPRLCLSRCSSCSSIV